MPVAGEVDREGVLVLMRVGDVVVVETPRSEAAVGPSETEGEESTREGTCRSHRRRLDGEVGQSARHEAQPCWPRCLERERQRLVARITPARQAIHPLVGRFCERDTSPLPPPGSLCEHEADRAAQQPPVPAVRERIALLPGAEEAAPLGYRPGGELRQQPLAHRRILEAEVAPDEANSEVRTRQQLFQGALVPIFERAVHLCMTGPHAREHDPVRILQAHQRPTRELAPRYSSRQLRRGVQRVELGGVFFAPGRLGEQSGRDARFDRRLGSGFRRGDLPPRGQREVDLAGGGRALSQSVTRRCGHVQPFDEITSFVRGVHRRVTCSNRLFPSALRGEVVGDPQPVGRRRRSRLLTLRGALQLAVDGRWPQPQPGLLDEPRQLLPFPCQPRLRPQ